MFSPEDTPLEHKTPVIGLVGYSYAGKSSAAEGAADILASDGLGVTIIRKDDAIREAGRLLTGESGTEHAYSAGSRDEQAIRRIINHRIKEELPYSDILILEGGVRTPASATAVLAGVENRTKLTIVTFDVSVPNLYRRFRQRRGESERADDAWWLASAKIGGQAIKNAISRQEVPGARYRTLDANRPINQVAQALSVIAYDELLRSDA